MSLERTVVNLMQRLEKHFYGKYRGIVVSNEDPENLGRLKVKVPSVLGKDIVTGWAMPCVPYGGAANQGMLFIPQKDDGVWIEFEEGDLEFPIWTGTFWTNPGGTSELPKVNDAEGTETEIQNPVTSKVIKTLKGHTLQFEDKDDEEMILLVQVSGDETINRIKMNAEGIVIEQRIDGSNSNFIEMLDSGIVLTDFTGNSIEMSDSAFTITSAVDLTIDASGQKIEMLADAIDLNQG